MPSNATRIVRLINNQTMLARHRFRKTDRGPGNRRSGVGRRLDAASDSIEMAGGGENAVSTLI